MEKIIKEIINSLKKERILMYKIVESEEKQDRVFFNYGTSIYKDIANNTDNLINDLLSIHSYKEAMDYILENYSNDDELSYDVFTLLGLINTKLMNRISNDIYNKGSDSFSNVVISNLYNFYLWYIRKNNYDREIVNEMRYDIVNTLVSSLAMREYFKGNYNVFDNIDLIEERSELENLFFNALNNKIISSNTLEMFDGITSDNEMFARKEMMKIEFSSLARLMMEEDIKFPLVVSTISDFTENIMRDASDVLTEYNKKEKIKEKIIKL